MTLRRTIRPNGECKRHLPAVLAAVAGVAEGAGPAAADHLERCRTCRAEAGEMALALIRIRRWARESARAEAPDDGWLRLRARLESSRRRAREAAWRARANLAGMMTATLLVAVVVGPLSVSGSAHGWSPAREPSGPSDRDPFVGAIELAYVQRVRLAVVGRQTSIGGTAPVGQPMWPDGIRPGMKEVTPTTSTVRTRDVS